MAYCLRITDVDPLDYDLIFERFLNPERVSLPDIDIDFCERRRGEVIDYVTQKYGRENVAQIITFGTMKARAVVRDVGRSLDIPFADVDRVAKLIPPALDMTLEKALEEVPQLKQLNEQDERVKELIAVARRLEGMTRHASVHAAGVVIAPRAIIGVRAALQGQERRNHDPVGDEGDRAHRPPEDGLSRAEHADAAERRRRGDSRDDRDDRSISTRFRSTTRRPTRCSREGAGLRHLPVRELGHARHSAQGQAAAARRPHRVERAVPARPAAQRHGRRLHRAQARPRQGESTKSRSSSRSWPTPTASSRIRNRSCASRSRWPASRWARPTCCARPWARRNAEVMRSSAKRSWKARRSSGINEKKATKIFELMEHFAGYGFNKSHSTAYALLAYQTAYLKANYPWHFAAALLTIEAQNTDKLAVYLQECRDRGIPVLPPDINKSQLAFTVTPEGVRFGLTAVKNVGEGAIASILGVRAAQGTITSLHALCDELDLRLVNKRVLESLVKAGAFDSFGARRERSVARRAARAADGDDRSRVRVRRAAAARSRRRPGAAVRRRGTGRRGSRRGADRARRTSSRGPKCSSSPMKRSRSACISAAIPSIAWRPS